MTSNPAEENKFYIPQMFEKFNYDWIDVSSPTGICLYGKKKENNGCYNCAKLYSFGNSFEK